MGNVLGPDPVVQLVMHGCWFCADTARVCIHCAHPADTFPCGKYNRKLGTCPECSGKRQPRPNVSRFLADVYAPNKRYAGMKRPTTDSRKGRAS